METKIIRLGLVLSIPVMIAGCLSYSGGDSIKPLSAELAASARVDSIVVRNVPADVSEGFKPALTAALRSKMSDCATGQTPLSLEVSVSHIKSQNGVRTILVGDSNGIKGTARFIRPETGEVVGDYDISRTLAAGGLLGTGILNGAERQGATDFANEICSHAFPAKKKKK